MSGAAGALLAVVFAHVLRGAGGRVLSVTAWASDLAAARDLAYRRCR